jgi:hypothetical protein
MQTAYTGETKRLSMSDDATCLVTRRLNDDPNQRTEIDTLAHTIRAQTDLLRAARSYIQQARLLLDEVTRFRAAAEQYPTIQLPPQIATILQEVQS